MSDHEQPAESVSQPAAKGSLGSYTDTEWDITTGVGFTALAVAAGRAMETARPDSLITDPQASAFVEAGQPVSNGVGIPLPTEWPPEAAELSAATGADGAQMREVWETMASYQGVRSRFFDQYFHTAVHQEGIRQVVLLAAGLDTRAHRLAWPSGTKLFEIDHPNVLAFKDKVLTERDARAECERHAVGVDLRDDWPSALRAADFDPNLPTAWLAEGLLMYLPDEAKQRLCERVQELSAPGSQLAIESIVDPGAAMATLRDNTVLQRMADQLGTDPSGLWPVDQEWEPDDWLVRHGWAVTRASAHTVAARYQRALTGPIPTADAQHPSVLLWAHYEQPHAAEDSG